MSSALSSAVSIGAYLSLFAGVGLIFLFANMLVGKFLRPDNPHEEKLEIYECGEPTIGSSFVQFDLRFYVVALLFIIFDVEVAFFFPWATVFGKSLELANSPVAVVERTEQGITLTKDAANVYREFGVRVPKAATSVPASLSASVPPSADSISQAELVTREGFRQLAWITVLDILVFFAVLMVGFLYVWKRGDLDWVRAVSRERTVEPVRSVA